MSSIQNIDSHLLVPRSDRWVAVPVYDAPDPVRVHGDPHEHVGEARLGTAGAETGLSRFDLRSERN